MISAFKKNAYKKKKKDTFEDISFKNIPFYRAILTRFPQQRLSH